MATVTTTRGRRSPSRTAGAALAAGVLGLVLGALLYRFPPQLGLSLVGGLAMIAVLALAIARYHAAVALAFALLGVVLIEPAPADGVFLVLMAIALVGRRFRLWPCRSRSSRRSGRSRRSTSSRPCRFPIRSARRPTS